MKELLNTLCSPPPDFSVQQAHRAAAEAFGLNGETELLGGERDRNFLQRADGRDVLLKVANPAEPDQLLDFQCAALRHIMRQDPGLPVPVIIKTQDGRDWATAPSTNGVDFRIRAFDFLPGLMLKDAPDDPRLMRNLGKMLARLNRALRGFFHPAANHLLAWDLKRIDSLAELASSISNRSEKEMVRHLLQRFGEEVRPRLSGLRAQVIHNDVSYHNSVVDPEAPFEITGIFDFGDLIYAPLIQDLAVTAAEAAAGRIDPVARCAEIVAGFHGVSPLEDKEFRILPDLVAARLALALLLDSWTGQNLEWEDDREYLVGWRADAASMLGQINDMDPGEFEALLRSACGASPSAKHVQEEQDRAASRDYDLLWQRRLKLLGNANYVAYDRPIHMVRGEGVWLYDAGRKAYLDAYNNVPHVGHCHPRVVAAVARQTATLNTNTRYVYDSLPTYAERLTATLPEGLEVCYFVSSGSEANDLAWRLAKAWTGNGGGLIMQDAYHGVTDAVYELSPIEWNEQRQLSAHIATITAPDDYRGPWKRDVADRGQRYAMDCDQAIKRLQQNGFDPAAFFMDMILCSNGIMVPPPGYLEETFRRIHAAGGLCVADEVQSGFGRLGKTMWGFESGDVVPDIVTFGKPIAGGYPMGLVVTTRAIADRFQQHGEFFSTTGGNPVACAAALAVLDVIEDEDLMHNADRVGAELADGLRKLASHHALIGDVRGSGLFIGVDLVKSRDSLEPATDETHTIVNILREDGVLIGIDGVHRNVLKIRPPMVFNSGHAKHLLRKLDNAFNRYFGSF